MATTNCPECGRAISVEAAEPAGGKAVPGKTGERYNARLAITAFIGGTGSLVLSTLGTLLINQMLGSYAMAGNSIAASVVTALSRVLIILLIIGFFKRAKILNYIAIGYEATAALLLILVPSWFAGLFGSGELITYASAYLRMAGILWLVVGGLCVLFGFVIRKRKMMFYFIFLGGAHLLSLFLSWLLVIAVGAGSVGAAFSTLLQPVEFLLPLLLFNPDGE